MSKNHLKELFENYDPSVKKIILGVLSVEQEHISMERPRVKDEIDNIVTAIANKEIEENVSKDDKQESES